MPRTRHTRGPRHGVRPSTGRLSNGYSYRGLTDLVRTILIESWYPLTVHEIVEELHRRGEPGDPNAVRHVVGQLRLRRHLVRIEGVEPARYTA